MQQFTDCQVVGDVNNSVDLGSLKMATRHTRGVDQHFEGGTNERIAATLYITQPTLRKHYFSELKFRDVARDRLVAGMMTKHWELFMAGNVAAGKEFRDLLKENDLMLYGQTVQPQKPPLAPKEPKLGKKEQALLAAQQPDIGSTLGELMARRQGGLN